MILKLLAILNLIISVQALFLCIHFSFKTKGVKVLNRLLAFLCFSFAFISLNTCLNLLEIDLLNALRQDISNNLMWFIGPVLYLYVIYNDKKPSRQFIYINTIPFTIPAAVDIIFDWVWFTEIVPFLAFTQMSVYLFLSIKYALTHYSNARQYYNWILPSVLALATLIVLNFSLSILGTIGISIVSNTVLQSFTSLLVIPIFFMAYKEMNSTNDLGIAPRKYETSQLPEKKSKAFLNSIEKAMKVDKLYLQKDLTLKSFSEHVDINPKYTSQLINQKLNMSFSDYVFKFRFEDVKLRLIDPKNKHLTIFGIAQESGFKSNSRFNYLFKKHTGLTPKQYQKQHAK